MIDVGHRDGGSLVAVAGGEIVGHAMYARENGDDEAEVAVVVEDRWQSRGVGKLLLAGLARLTGRRVTLTRLPVSTGPPAVRFP